MSTKVFISHGRDELTKHKLKDFLRDRLNVEPIVLAEQPDLGLTVVEKLEHYGKDCKFALILLTGDDETATGGHRARQNVIHELGYFHGLIGRNRVLLLKEPGVEVFSNISGLVYKEFPRGSIQTVFDDIRLAIESGEAAKHGASVPKEPETETAEDTEAAKDMWKMIWEKATSGEQTYSKALHNRLSELSSGSLPAPVKKAKLRSFLQTELEQTREINTEDGNPAAGLVMAIANSAVRSKRQALAACLSILDAWPEESPIDDLFRETANMISQYLGKGDEADTDCSQEDV